MPRAPYIIFGFDVPPNVPNGGAILADVENNFPITQGIGPLGVDQAFFLELPPATALQVFRNVATYLLGKDNQHQGALRWFVQFCRTSEIAGN